MNSPLHSPCRDTPENLASIILPCKDAARHLEAMIDALRMLEIPPGWGVELVAGYQASRDETLQILTDQGVKIAHSNEQGPGAARNAAVRMSSGSLLVFMDSDALPADSKLLARIIRKAGDLGGFGGLGGPILIHPSQAWNPVAIADHLSCWFNWTQKRNSETTDLFQPTTFFVMQRDIFNRLGGFDVRIRILEDYELQERIKALSLPLHFDNSLPVFHYARDSFLRSLKHSWSWGPPFRTFFLKNAPSPSWLPVREGPWFWVNLPSIFFVRLRIIFSKTCRDSPGSVLYCLPFLLAAVFAWALGVTFGKDQQTGATQ